MSTRQDLEALAREWLDANAYMVQPYDRGEDETKSNRGLAEARGVALCLGMVGVAVAYGMLAVNEYLRNDHVPVQDSWIPQDYDPSERDMAALVRAVVLP